MTSEQRRIFWSVVLHCSFIVPLTCASSIVHTDVGLKTHDAATCLKSCGGDGSSSRPIIVGVAGGSGCGKTTLAQKIVELSCAGDVMQLSTDSYYRSLSEADHQLALDGNFNFDVPEALDLDILADHLRAIRATDTNWPLQFPSYDFISHRRVESNFSMERPRALVVEGIFVLAAPELRELLDVRVFARDDVDICLVQRLRRDTESRGIPVSTALTQYERYVKPSFDAIVAPSATFAHIVVPNATRNEQAADLVAGWIWSRNVQGCLHESKSNSTHVAPSRSEL